MSNRIFWRTTEPIDAARLGWDKDDRPIPVPKDVWTIKPGIKNGDRVALAFLDGEPVLTAPVRGTTLRAIFSSIHRGMNAALTKKNALAVYALIGRHQTSQHQRLAKRFEQGELTPRDLVQNGYDFYEGHLKRNGGVWTYSVGN